VYYIIFYIGGFFQYFLFSNIFFLSCTIEVPLDRPTNIILFSLTREMYLFIHTLNLYRLSVCINKYRRENIWHLIFWGWLTLLNMMFSRPVHLSSCWLFVRAGVQPSAFHFLSSWNYRREPLYLAQIKIFVTDIRITAILAFYCKLLNSPILKLLVTIVKK
jgi:hypothetical protein